MMPITPLWFDSYLEWVRYVNKHMMNAEKQDGPHYITLKNDSGQTIASWQKPDCGQVYENRTTKRLAEDKLKLK